MKWYCLFIFIRPDGRKNQPGNLSRISRVIVRMTQWTGFTFDPAMVDRSHQHVGEIPVFTYNVGEYDAVDGEHNSGSSVLLLKVRTIDSFALCAETANLHGLGWVQVGRCILIGPSAADGVKGIEGAGQGITACHNIRTMPTGLLAWIIIVVHLLWHALTRERSVSNVINFDQTHHSLSSSAKLAMNNLSHSFSNTVFYSGLVKFINALVDRDALFAWWTRWVLMILNLLSREGTEVDKTQECFWFNHTSKTCSKCGRSEEEVE